MTDNKVEDFPLRAIGKETPERILKSAMKWKGVRDIIVVADIDGEVFVSGTPEKAHELLGFLELGKFRVLETTREDDE